MRWRGINASAHGWLLFSLAAASLVLLAGLLWFSASMYADEREARLQGNAEKSLAATNVID